MYNYIASLSAFEDRTLGLLEPTLLYHHIGIHFGWNSAPHVDLMYLLMSLSCWLEQRSTAQSSSNWSLCAGCTSRRHGKPSWSVAV